MNLVVEFMKMLADKFMAIASTYSSCLRYSSYFLLVFGICFISFFCADFGDWLPLTALPCAFLFTLSGEALFPISGTMVFNLLSGSVEVGGLMALTNLVVEFM